MTARQQQQQQQQPQPQQQQTQQQRWQPGTAPGPRTTTCRAALLWSASHCAPEDCEGHPGNDSLLRRQARPQPARCHAPHPCALPCTARLQFATRCVPAECPTCQGLLVAARRWDHHVGDLWVPVVPLWGERGHGDRQELSWAGRRARTHEQGCCCARGSRARVRQGRAAGVSRKHTPATQPLRAVVQPRALTPCTIPSIPVPCRSHT